MEHSIEEKGIVMICKYCGSEIPDESKICFVCNKTIQDDIKNDKQDMIQKISKENEDLYLMPYHFGRGFEKYKDIKRKFIFNIILSPILVVVLWFIFIYINPIIAVVVFGMAIVMIPKEMSAQYKVIKAKRKKDGK